VLSQSQHFLFWRFFSFSPSFFFLFTFFFFPLNHFLPSPFTGNSWLVSHLPCTSSLAHTLIPRTLILYTTFDNHNNGDHGENRKMTDDLQDNAPLTNLECVSM
jgi:hypothetical protein